MYDGLVELIDELSRVTELPTFASTMGKSCVNEQLPNYGGIYGGGGSHADVRTAVESSDASESSQAGCR